MLGSSTLSTFQLPGKKKKEYKFSILLFFSDYLVKLYPICQKFMEWVLSSYSTGKRAVKTTFLKCEENLCNSKKSIKTQGKK